MANFLFCGNNFQTRKRFFIETPKDDQQIVGNVFFGDIDGQPVFFLRVLLDREIYRNGQEGIRLFQRGMVAAIVVFSALFFFLLDRLVLRRLSHLSRQVEKIGSSSDSQGEVFLEGKDEISGLAHQINAMLSALRTIEMNRKESEKRFRTLADSAPVLIWMTDSTNQCIYVNRGWLDYTGRSLEEELGAGFLENIYLDDARRVIDAYEKAFSQQQGLSVEFRLKRKDESYGWVFSRAIPHFTANNVFLGYIGSCVDITERKEAENQNKKRIEEIEKINRVMVERELKMIELKEQIRKLQGHA
jgi:PAS domain S-box-containing protein